MLSTGWQSAAPRVAIYSQDGFGLGHMRRTSSIASKLLELRPDAAVLTLSDSRLGQFFQTARNHDYVKLPSIVKAGPGDWRAASLPLDFSEVLAMRQDLIRSALLGFAPHLLLVDHMPHGAMGELLPALETIRSKGLPTKIVLGLRDILDAPEVVRSHWASEGAYQAVECFYDRVLVYGMRDLYDVAEAYQFSPGMSAQLRYCGYVCTPDSARSVEKLRTRYLAGGTEKTRLVVAMAGGGADAFPMMQALLDALPLVRQRQPCVLVLITGPFMPAGQMADLQKQARRTAARVIASVDDTLSYLAAADLVVAMAGYNTSTEILRLKKNAILIPRRGPSAEQRTRARLFASHGWVDAIDPDNLAPEALAERIIRRLCSPPAWPENSRPDLHGLTVAACQLLAIASAGHEAAGLPLPAQPSLQSSDIS